MVSMYRFVNANDVEYILILICISIVMPDKCHGYWQGMIFLIELNNVCYSTIGILHITRISFRCFSDLIAKLSNIIQLNLKD